MLILFNLFIFLIPIKKTGAFWISDIFVLISVVINVFIERLFWGRMVQVKQKFYGYPIFLIGKEYMLVTMVFAVIFITASSIMVSCTSYSFPLWLVLCVYFAIIGVMLIRIILLTSIHDRITEGDIKIEHKTDFMRKLYQDMLALQYKTEDKEIKRMLEKLSEKVRYSDPVSSPFLYEIEDRLMLVFEELRLLLIDGEGEQVKEKAELFSQILAERNIQCKQMKNYE